MLLDDAESAAGCGLGLLVRIIVYDAQRGTWKGAAYR
jgi:hypothetical protein